jgi:hypothetical protein
MSTLRLALAVSLLAACFLAPPSLAAATASGPCPATCGSCDACPRECPPDCCPCPICCDEGCPLCGAMRVAMQMMRHAPAVPAARTTSGPCDAGSCCSSIKG